MTTTPADHFHGAVLILEPSRWGIPLLRASAYLYVCPRCGKEYDELYAADKAKYVNAASFEQLRNEEVLILPAGGKGEKLHTRSKKHFIASCIDAPLIAHVFRVLPADAPAPRGYTCLATFGGAENPMALYAGYTRPTCRDARLCESCRMS